MGLDSLYASGQRQCQDSAFEFSDVVRVGQGGRMAVLHGADSPGRGRHPWALGSTGALCPGASGDRDRLGCAKPPIRTFAAPSGFTRYPSWGTSRVAASRFGGVSASVPVASHPSVGLTFHRQDGTRELDGAAPMVITTRCDRQRKNDQLVAPHGHGEPLASPSGLSRDALGDPHGYDPLDSCRELENVRDDCTSAFRAVCSELGITLNLGWR